MRWLEGDAKQGPWQRRSPWLTLAAATGLHALSFFVLREVAPHVARMPENVPREIAVDMALEDAPEPAPPEPAPAAAPPEARSLPSPEKARPAPAARAAKSTTLDPGDERTLHVTPGPSEPLRTGDSPAAEPWSFSPTTASTGSRVRASIEGGAARIAAQSAPGPAPPKPNGGLSQGLDERDLALGLGRGGPVRSAVEFAAHTRDAPGEGNADFDVAILADGTVSVVLEQASQSYEAWRKLAAAIQSRLPRGSVRIPPGSRGLSVRIHVDAHEQFVDGTKPKDLGTKAEAHGFEIKETKDSVMITKTPGVSVTVRGKVCSAAFSLDLRGPMIGGGCSLENAGNAPVRVVSTRIVSESRF